MPSISREALRQYKTRSTATSHGKSIADLRIAYSQVATLHNHFAVKLAGIDRIYPKHLPIQTSGRWSTIDPPFTNFPKKCINPECPKERHRKTEQCWSMRDLVIPDPDEYWIEFDLDAAEARVYALILGWQERLDEFLQGSDVHTPVTCSLFGLPYPSDKIDPHTSAIDEQWRIDTKWQGKDDKRRTMSKNFTFGGQYFYVKQVKSTYRARSPYRVYKGLCYNPGYVFEIPDITDYGLEERELVNLAVKFFEGNWEIQAIKAEEMALIGTPVRIQGIGRTYIARDIYGGRRLFWVPGPKTAKDGFNHRVQGSVANYINETAIRLTEAFPHCTIIHNAHDNLKTAFPLVGPKERQEQLEAMRPIVERELSYSGCKTKLTATYKIHLPPEVLEKENYHGTRTSRADSCVESR